MARGRVLRGSWLVGLGIGLGLVVAPLPRSVPDAGAIVICQNKKKAKLVALRADKCTRKEKVAVDLSGVVGSQGQMLTQQGQTLATAEAQIGLTCAGRKLVASKFSTPPDPSLVPRRGLLRQRAGGGCRTLDGNQAACNAAFQNDDPFTSNEEPAAASCFFVNGRCLPCLNPAESLGACTNACYSQPKCTDANRTVLAGGPGENSHGNSTPGRHACQQFKTQADCEKAWHLGQLAERDHAASCYWTGTLCQGCGPRHATAGDCTNACAPAPSCKDPARVTLAGATKNNACMNYNGDQTNCEKSWHLGRDGVASCWYDATVMQCRGCGHRWEATGKCSNTCL